MSKSNEKYHENKYPEIAFLRSFSAAGCFHSTASVNIELAYMIQYNRNDICQKQTASF